ncbi:ABC transporter ATP-binding protein [Candidatus Poribacteria bacterium]|nr:ABC transporter ATP-binding protein [Candidatus Poribacteria bacterium]
MADPLLSVRELSVAFRSRGGWTPAVSDVSFDIHPAETVALVGESGSGKSVTALAVLRLIRSHVGRIVASRLSLQGVELLSLAERDMRRVRGSEIAMIFQEPMTSLNPVFQVGDQLAAAATSHRQASASEVRGDILSALESVGIPDPVRQLRAYPHELSGGMRQRVMIAMAIVRRPALLIADEPTTALDVTVQAQILDVLRRLRDERGMAMLLISHDMGVVAEMSERVLVMYAGEIVEDAPVNALFGSPGHPYTQGLLRSVPTLTGDADRLVPIDGVVPTPGSWGSGCRFATRCSARGPICSERTPELSAMPGSSTLNETAEDAHSHNVRCFAISHPSMYNDTRLGHEHPDR